MRSVPTVSGVVVAVGAIVLMLPVAISLSGPGVAEGSNGETQLSAESPPSTGSPSTAETPTEDVDESVPEPTLPQIVTMPNDAVVEVPKVSGTGNSGEFSFLPNGDDYTVAFTCTAPDPSATAVLGNLVDEQLDLPFICDGVPTTSVIAGAGTTQRLAVAATQDISWIIKIYSGQPNGAGANGQE